MRNHQSESKRRKFKQVVSQVNYYTRQWRTKYGFVVTDREFVAIERADSSGDLQLSAPIPMTAHGPRLTVPMALWYLAMTAGADEDAGHGRHSRLGAGRCDVQPISPYHPCQTILLVLLMQ